MRMYSTFLFSLLTRSLLALCMVAAFSTVGFAREPTNLDTLKKELVKYHDSGEYYQDITSVQQQAIAYLLQRIAENNQLPADKQKKLAIVLDIDETALSNYRDMVAMDFGGSLAQQQAAQALGTDPAIPGTLALYKIAVAKGVSVFFVSGRVQTEYAGTVKNLRDAGYKTWAGLIMRPVNYNQPSIVPFKSGARQKIEDAGYDIVLDVGDQKSDLEGGYADQTFKLPNPYYLIP